MSPNSVEFVFARLVDHRLVPVMNNSVSNSTEAILFLWLVWQLQFAVCLAWTFPIMCLFVWEWFLSWTACLPTGLFMASNYVLFVNFWLPRCTLLSSHHWGSLASEFCFQNVQRSHVYPLWKVLLSFACLSCRLSEYSPKILKHHGLWFTLLNLKTSQVLN